MGPPARPPRTFGGVARKVLSYLLNPKGAAQRALKPQNRLAPPDPRIDQISLIRTLIGMAVVVWVGVKYDSVEGDKIVSEAVLHITVSVVVAMVAVPLCALAFVLLSHDNVRRETRRAMRYPMMSMAWFLGAGGLLAAVTATGLVQARPDNPGLWVLLLLGLAGFIWTGFFAIFAFFLVPRHLFAAADGHLLMPSLLAPTLSWAVAAVDLASPGNNRVPTVIAMVVTLGAPVTITALSVWEAKRVRDLYGVTFRGGPQPARIPAHAVAAAQQRAQRQASQAAMVNGLASRGLFGWLPGLIARAGTVPSASWSGPHTGGGTATGYQPAATGVRPFPHVAHVVGVLFTCGLWTFGYLGSYLRWKRRSAAAARRQAYGAGGAGAGQGWY
ncbi:hypothetical protein [Yinghuangia sp. YIM S09857]|uniref:hypothetical protein n=1 Tax=Yinghuangia sp. YIM S09857 TaxID=3436929 RepID=UPI003F53E426